MAWLEKLIGQLSNVIKAAATSRLGLFALMIIALSLIALIFFQDAGTPVRVGIFGLMFGGAALLGVRLFRAEPIRQIAHGQDRPTERAAASKSIAKAQSLLGQAESARLSGRNDQARAAYTEARALYKQVEDRLGEANVLLGFGRLEADTNAELAKQYFYQAAHLYSAIGMPDWERTALDEATKLSSP